MEFTQKSQNKTVLSAALFAAILFSSSLGMAQASSSRGSSFFGSGSMSKKSQAKEGSRWTLQEWLAQKQRNSLMDQWLMMNSPSPFEFFISGDTSNYKYQKNLETRVTHNSSSGAAGAYAQAIGLTGEYENNLDENLTDVSGALSIRLLGSSLQTTSMTLHLGQRTRQYMENTEKESVRNLFAELAIQAYFTKYFGLMGSYRNYYPTDHSTLGEVTGTHVEGGIFIDFGSLRVFGNWSDELQTNKATNGTKTEYKRQGLKSGIVIFF